MKKYIFLSFIIFFCPKLIAQVGIGNTDPKSTLDISATNVATPSNTDGILIPRVDDFPISNPTVDQDGMMVFATGNGTPSKGFYYWDNGSTSWVAISSGVGSDDDWYEENTTSPPTSNSADIFTDGNVGIGLNNVLYPLHIETINGSRTVSLLNENTGSSVYGIRNTIDESAPSSNGSSNGIANIITRTNQTSISGVSNSFTGSVSTNSFGYLFGYQNSFGNSTSTSSYGLINRFQGTSGTAYGASNLIGGPITNFYGVDNHNITGSNLSGTFYGLYNSLTGSDSGNRYGVYTNFSETGSGNKYGEFITIPTSAGGTHYGIYSDVQNGSGFAGYFLGRTSLGNGTTNRYLMPATDGTAGQVMTTDGAGNITFATPTTGAQKIDDLTDGKSDSDGTQDGSSIFLGVGSGSSDNSADNRNVAIGFEAMNSNIVGGLGVAIGYQALANAGISSTHRSVAIGYQSLNSNSIGIDNVGVGIWSLYNLGNGGYNTVLGGRSMIDLTTGDRNVALGYQAGDAVTSGDGNIFIGYNAGGSGIINNKLYIDNSSNANPLIYGEFDTNILRANGELQVGIPAGTGYAFPTIDGSNGQVLTTDGAGQLSFTTFAADTDWTVTGNDQYAANTGNVGIGDTTPDYKLDLEYTGILDRAFNIDFQNTAGTGIAQGLNVTAQSNSTGFVWGANVELINTNSSSESIGVRSINTSGANNKYGFAGSAIGAGSQNIGISGSARSATTNYGGYFTADLGGNINYGIVAIAEGGILANWAGYFGDSTPGSGNVFVSDNLRVDGLLRIDPTGTGYSFPAADGTAGQVLSTDGFGNVSFTTLSFTDTQNTLDEAYDEGGPGTGRVVNVDSGSLEFIGSGGTTFTNVVSHTGGGNGMQINTSGNLNSGGQISNGIELNNTINTNASFSRNYGIFNKMTINGTAANGVNYGIRNWFLPAGSAAGTQYGFHSSNQIAGGSLQYGYYSDILNNGNAEQYGYFSSIEGSGTGTKYGFRSSIPSTSGGTHYGIFSDTQNASGYAAYFIGRTSLGNSITNRYLMPAADGTAGQVIITDGAGNLSWTSATGEATTASNGLTETGNDVALGGTLSQITTIDQGNNNLRFDLTGTGDFMVLDNGTIEFIVEDSGDVGIGTNNPNYLLDVNESDNTKSIGVNIQKTDNTSTLNTAAMSVTKTASGTGSSSVITTFADGTGSGEQRGIYNILNGAGTGNKYGVKNELSSASNGLQYGMENNFSGGTSSVRYAIRNNFTAGTGTQLGMYNSFANNSTGSDTGISNFFSGTNAAAKTGLSNIFTIASAGDQTGIINSFGSTSNTNKVGGYTSFSSTTGGTMYGFQVDVSATGATNKYGIYVDFDAAVTGTNNYGVYSIVDNSDGWAGYFEGKNYVADAIGINNTNPDGRLDIIHNSTSETSPHIMITAQNANSGSRITFDNAAETTNSWVLFARADDTPGAGVLNFYSSEITANVLRLESDGKIGIMRNPTTNALEVEGDASKTTAGAFIANSDRRLKKDIKSISGETALDKIEKMRGVTYVWNDDKTGTKRPEGLQYGFIAQELMEVFPEKVTKDNLGFYQTAYGDYDPIFVEAIKELKTEVETLKEENQKLKEQLSKMEKIEARLSALENNSIKNNVSEMISEKKK